MEECTSILFHRKKTKNNHKNVRRTCYWKLIFVICCYSTWARKHTKHARHVGKWACKARKARKHARHIGTWARKHARHVGTWARKHARHVSTRVEKHARHVATMAGEHVSTQDTLSREHVSTQGTVARGHVSTQFSRLKERRRLHKNLWQKAQIIKSKKETKECHIDLDCLIQYVICSYGLVMKYDLLDT